MTKKVHNRGQEMIILALDTGLKTGWAVQIGDWRESGVQDFSRRRGESNGLIFLRFRAWLKEMIELNTPDLIVYEQAHHRGGAATELCVGFTTRVQEAAAEYKIEYMGVHSGSLKKAILGTGRADKKDMMAWFGKQRERPAIDDNEADAYALLVYAKKEFQTSNHIKGGG